MWSAHPASADGAITHLGERGRPAEIEIEPAPGAVREHEADPVPHRVIALGADDAVVEALGGRRPRGELLDDAEASSNEI